MKLYLVDDTEKFVDPEFDAALFVYAENPTHAARLWEDYYKREATEARVTEVPTPHQIAISGALLDVRERVIEWDRLPQTIVKLYVEPT